MLRADFAVEEVIPHFLGHALVSQFDSAHRTSGARGGSELICVMGVGLICAMNVGMCP